MLEDNTLFQTLVKCFCLPEVISVGIALGFFVIAFALYLLLLYSFRRIFRNPNRIGRELVEALRFPVLLILFEIAAIASANILGLKEHFEGVVEHTMVILIILTIGWVLIATARSLFRHAMGKLHEEAERNHARRAILTQILFLYRIAMFVIVAVTLASILMTFPHIKSVGVGILGSAGIAGIALGIAARPILLNLMAGFQLAFSKTVKIGDAVIVEGDFARIESLHLTHVVARTWDLRRIILPVSYFIDKPFQNWDKEDPELLGSVFFYCDYSVPVDVIRNKVEEILKGTPLWNQKVWRVHVTDLTEKTMQLRIIMTAEDAPTAFELRCHVREKLINFLKSEYPESFPCFRIKEFSTS